MSNGIEFAKLFALLLLQPDKQIELEERFIATTIVFCEQLHSSGLFEELITTYRSAIEIYPKSIVLLNSFGEILVRLGDMEQAFKVIEQATIIDKYSLISKRNLNQIKDMLIPRWHYRMLNDYKRNISYQNAILKQINKSFDVVLDIGTGTGLLSLFASEGKSKAVYACDYSKIMCNIAQKVFKENNCCDIHLMNMNSVDINTSTFPKVSLIVTEIFDCGVFGENIINSIQHAIDNLTLSNYEVIPQSLTVYIAGIQSEMIFRKVRLKSLTSTGLTNIDLLAHSYDDEPYTTEDLKIIKDIKYLTEVQVLYDISLKCKNLKKYMKSKKNTFITCINDGYIDGFAVWMTLKLDDENFISTSPHISEFCCWDQALFTTKQQFSVKQNEKIEIISYCQEMLVIENKFLSGSNNSIPLPKLVITFLNDNLYIEKLRETFSILKNGTVRYSKIMDLSPFPVLGLLMLKENLSDYLVCNEYEDNVKLFINLIAQLNGTSINKIHFSKISNIDESYKFDLIVFNWIHNTGEFSDDLLLQANLINLLKKECLMIPCQINMYGLLVECKWLDFITKVQNSNVNNYKIAEFINKFSIEKHIDFKIETINYTPCSGEIDLGSLNIENKRINNKIQVSVLNDCKVNGIVYWYEINLFNCLKYSTKHLKSYINNAAFVFDSKDVKTDDLIHLDIVQTDGLLHVDINTNIS